MHENAPNIGHLIQTLFPIIVFIGWFLISMYTKTKNMPPRKNLPKPQDFPPRDYEQDHSEHTNEKPKISDDLKRALDILYKGESGSSESGQYDNREEESAPAENSSDLQSAESIKVDEQMAALQKKAAELQMQAASERSSSQVQKSSTFQTENSSDSEDFSPESINELRRAVVWSEVLGKPISIRED